MLDQYKAPVSETLTDENNKVYSFRVYVQHGTPEEVFSEIKRVFVKDIKQDCPFCLEDIQESFETYEDHSKANIHKDGWNLYHGCKCNDFVLHVDFNTTLKSYVA